MKLLHWGKASLEKSINQPTLPHAVIVLNASPMGIDFGEWDDQIATENLLATLRSSLDPHHGVPELHELADEWQRDRGIQINTVHDLIRRYYSSFTVVRVPDAQGRYTRVDQQMQVLQNVITRGCKSSQRTKRLAKMMFNADELDGYLQSAYDHFTTNLTDPFNFIDASLRNNPLPETFGDHIKQLAVAILEVDSIQSKRKPMAGEQIFSLLSAMVASCIMLDATMFRKGLSKPGPKLMLDTDSRA